MEKSPDILLKDASRTCKRCKGGFITNRKSSTRETYENLQTNYDYVTFQDTSEQTPYPHLNYLKFLLL